MTLTLVFQRGLFKMLEHYRKLPEHRERNYYAQYVRKDPYLSDVDVLAGVIRERATTLSLPVEKVALSFVQSLTYWTPNRVPGGPQSVDYQQYAVQTLINGGGAGDCGDKSLLLVALLKALGIRCVLLQYPGHMAVGIHPRTKLHRDTRYEYENTDYYYSEVTTPGWDIGEKPGKMPTSATILPCR
ncbi:MAG: hypothetical protein IPL52_01595 [Flavobacteriales bacterium]|nr:hypothetical protein [Flavobacteriales bacterium]